MAILLDGRIMSAPVIRSKISDRVRIDGDFSREQALRAARALAPLTRD
jgi:preprotein translocase subunit SecD